MFKQIVVANDGSDGGFRALTMACDLAKVHRSKLRMISVEVLPDFPASVDEIVEEKETQNHRFHEVVQRARGIAKAKGVKLEIDVLAGHAAASIVERAKTVKADLVVAGF